MRPNDALNEITSIREKLELIESRQSLRSWSIAVSAVVFAAFGICRSCIWVDGASGPQAFVTEWTIVFAVCSLLIMGELLWRCSNEYSRLTFSWTRQLARQLMPFALAGLLVTLSALQQQGALMWLPGLWSIVIGLGLFSCGKLLPSSSQLAAGWLIVVGGIAMSLPELSQSYPHWVMVASYSVGQAIFAASLYWGGNHDG